MIRLAKLEDINVINDFFEEAKEYFRLQGINQWQGVQPSELNIREDIATKQGYVYDDDVVKGYFFLSFDEEETYKNIYQGAWLNKGPYAVVHRVVVGRVYKNQGIARKMIDYCIEQVNIKETSLRVDTHKDNLVMKALIAKKGFTYCGIIHLDDSGERLAYEITI